MTATVEVRNLGNAPAEGVRFRLGGRLARSVAGQLPGPLAPGASAVLEFDGLIPTAAGRERLTVSVTCGGPCSADVRADASFEFDVAEPPPGAVTIRDDACAVIVRVLKGAPLPASAWAAWPGWSRSRSSSVRARHLGGIGRLGIGRKVYATIAR